MSVIKKEINLENTRILEEEAKKKEVQPVAPP